VSDPRADPDAEPDETIIVGGPLSAAPVFEDDDALEGTLVVGRAGTDAAPADGTLVVPAGIAPRRPRRGSARQVRITLPDETVLSPRAAEGAGVGPVDRYRPRQIPAPPRIEHLPPGPDASRAAAPAMPSVVRASRGMGRWALAAGLLACVVAVAGLVALGFALAASLAG
jgi:hypothetical protein